MPGCEEKELVLEKIKTLTDRITNTERQTKENTKDIHELRENKASNEEKFERIFELLGELKESIRGIKDSIDKKNDRLPTMVYTVTGIVLGSTISGVIVFLMTK